MNFRPAELGFAKSQCISVLVVAFVCGNPGMWSQAQVKTPAAVESPTVAAERGITLGAKGHCKEAMPILKKVIPKLRDKDLLHDAVMARAQCGMATDQRDVVDESFIVLRREFPGDPKVLYITTRYY